MIKLEKYMRTLFIFNDNEEDFISATRHLVNPDIPYTTSGRNGGNAKIRTYQIVSEIRAIGVPTGSNDIGYQVMDDKFNEIMKLFKARLVKRLNTSKYSAVILKHITKLIKDTIAEVNAGTVLPK